MFCQFKSLAENDVKNLVMKSNKKTCGSDPMPTKFVVDCLDFVLPVLTKIINLSLGSGSFHSDWKLAHG